MVATTRWRATKRAMARAARAMATGMRMAGKQGTMAMARATTWAMSTARRWRATKRAMARAARAMAMAMRIAGDKEGNGKGGKSVMVMAMRAVGDKEGNGKGGQGDSNGSAMAMRMFITE
jgi:hypothetical protein